jgi:ATP-dependent metalloprotease
MEQTANNNPQSATAQNAFYSSLLRANHPELVVQRYESNNFATNAACEALYLRALERINSKQTTGQIQNIENGTSLTAEQIQAVSRAVGGGTKAATGQGANVGVRNNPLHVVVEQSLGSNLFRWFRFILWFVFTVYFVYIVIALFVESTGLFRRVGGGRPTEIKPELQNARFSDVHGCEEAKEELQEIVDFLKSPQKYGALGGKLPKGVLLVGPPGTGKTLLARAVAGEAGVPFFYMSGSEFDEVYVGVGAKRVRELFNAARSKAPAIVFIDELDAIGGKRNERDAAYAKQTLNQLLTDLDGFNQSSGIIFLAATNFPELLDSALTRPGRFDRQVVVGLPDVRGRVAILDHYLKKMRISANVDPSILARGTPGFSGAQLENLTNQAAVHASKRRATVIEMTDFEWAKDRILMGAERKSAIIQQKDKVMTAYHEGGHALVALLTPHADPLYKATIMPRGHALGITFQLPDIDKVSMAKQEYMAQIDVCMGGKVAEEIVYGPEATTGGASSDIQKATAIAYTMVTRLGMSPRLGNIDLDSDYGRLPAETKQIIWEEVRRLVDEGKARAEKILTQKRSELDRLANALVEYETLGKDEIERVIKGEKLPDTLKAIPEVPAPLKFPEIKLPLVPPQKES